MKIYIENQIFQYQKFGGISRYFSIFLDQIAKKTFVSKNIKCFLHNSFHSNLYLQQQKIGIKMPMSRVTRILGSIAFHISNEFIKKDSILFITYYGRNLDRAKNRGIKLISTLHDMIPEDGFCDSEKHIIPKKKETLHKSDIIVCVSNFSSRRLINFYPKLKDKIRVIKHISLLPLIKESNFLPLKLDKKPFIIAFSGKAEYKNINLLISTFVESELPKNNVTLLILGLGEGPHIKHKYINEKYLKNFQIEFLAPKDNLLKSLYMKSIGVCSLSSYEGFGIPIIESLYFNKKLIISDIEVHKEIGKTFSNFVNLNNKEDIIQCFNNLDKLKDPLSFLGESAYSKYIDYYSPQRFLEEYINLFNAL